MRTNPLIDAIYRVAKGNESTKVSENVRNARLMTCRNCPLITKLGTCGNGITDDGCGCVVALKTEYAEESCPKGKW
jgi:hypothetical protein